MYPSVFSWRLQRQEEGVREGEESMVLGARAGGLTSKAHLCVPIYNSPGVFAFLASFFPHLYIGIYQHVLGFVLA